MKRNIRFTIMIALITLGLVGCWQASATVPHPTGLYAYAQCAEDINSFYVIGGADEWNQPLDHFLRFDASQGIWYRLTPLPSPAMAAAASCYQGHIYVVTPMQDLYIYDIAAETWISGSPAPRPAWGTAIGVWKGKLYLVGGSPAEWEAPVNEVDVYDLATDTWTVGDAYLPVAAFLPGYIQAGPYLYLVGGFGTQSPAQNVDATQRYDMSSNTWELGPTFTSSRAAFSLSIQGYRLLAIGGDANGGTYLDEVADIESLDLNGWSGGAWGSDSPALPQARMLNPGSFCTEVLTGGEIWSVGGAIPDEEQLNPLSDNLFRDLYYSEWQTASTIPPDLYDKAIQRAHELGYVESQQGVTTNGNCYTGVFDLSVGASSLEESGLPGEVVTYTLALTNTGDIPDAYDISISADWPTEISSIEPIWPNLSSRMIVTVTVPTDAEPGEADTASITFTSQGDPTETSSLNLVTLRHTGVDLIPPSSRGSGALGTPLTYPITMLNATGQTDSFDLVLGPHNWETSLSADQVGPIPIGEIETFTVTVNIPAEVEWYLTDTVTITASAQNQPGYSGSAVLTSQAYAPPQISVDPLSLESTQMAGEIVTLPMTISNGNGVPLTFDIYGGSFFEGTTLVLHLDEPEGSNSFQDVSQMDNDGSCTGDSCPISGVPGHAGNAILFDGVDDYIQTPTNGFPTGSNDRTIMAWVKVNSVVAEEGLIAGYGNYGEWTQVYEIFIDYGESRELCFSQWGGSVYGPSLELGEWYHVAVTNVGDWITLYLNGTPVGSGSLELNTPAGTQYYSGRAPGEWGNDRRLNGFVDELAVFDRALTAEEIMLFYQISPGGDDPWLSIVPISGTVEANSSMPIQITLDATFLQPGIYTSALSVLSNDPLIPVVEIPVTMTVEPTPSMGWVEGIVSDLRTGEPLEATIIAEGQPYTITSDAETGYYKLWLEEGVYSLHISAEVYVSQSMDVVITTQQGVTQDIALMLEAPWLQVEPDRLEVTQSPGQVTTSTLTLNNNGESPLEFNLIGELQQGNVLYIRFDEPVGSTIFRDSSGWGNHGSCSGNNCPVAGAPGKYGYAIDLDGANDYISIPHNPKFDEIETIDEVTIAAWIKVESTLGLFPILDQYEANGDWGWMLEATQTGIYFYTSSWMSKVCNYVPNLYEWHHIAVTYNRGEGIVTFYADGIALCSVPNTADIVDTQGEPIYIGLSASGGDEYGNGVIDEVAVWNRSLSAAEVWALYQNSAFMDLPPWLEVEPISETIPINTSVDVSFTFDATVLQPDIYTTTVFIISNDPLNPMVEVPITMTVEPTPSMGWVEGIVTDLRTGQPLEATIIAEGQPYIITSDDETGDYKLWLEDGVYTLHISAEGYVPQSMDVEITAQQGITQDVALLLDAPWLGYTPEHFTITQAMGEVTTQTLILTNTGSTDLEYQLYENTSINSFSTAGLELYGYDVPLAWLRVIGLWDDTQVEVLNLDTGSVIAQNSDLDRYEIWDIDPGDGTYYKVIADRSVVGYSSNFGGSDHMTFVPSIDSGPIGTEFIFYYHCSYPDENHCYVFAIEDAQIDVYDPSGELVATHSLEAGDFWLLYVPNGVYHIRSTGRIAIESNGANAYSTVPSIDGSNTGYLFYFATHNWSTGAFVVFAYQDTLIEVYDLETGERLFDHALQSGEYWWQTEVHLKKLRLKSSGLVEVWAGSTEGGTNIEHLGDDISFTTGNNGLEFYTHSLMDGSVIFAPFDNTRINIDGEFYELDQDGYLHLAGCCYFRHIISNKPILIQTLGRDSGWNDTGTYLGGRTSRSDIPDWLSFDPVSGTIPSGTYEIVTISFNTTILQPDTYITTLYLSSNDPLNPLVPVPVTMTVEPTPSMGWVEGIVTDLRTGEPLEATIIAVGQPYTITSNAETGYYQFWLEQGTYTLEVSAPGYVTQALDVEVIAQQGVTEDFELSPLASWLQYIPEHFAVTHPMGSVITDTLILTNAGSVNLDFNIIQYEFPGERALQWLHFEEPLGSTFFYDSSGNNYHGFCSGTYCPIAGVPGISGNALSFDGTDDYVQLPELSGGCSEGSISLWVNLDSLPGDSAKRIWTAAAHPPNSGNSYDLATLEIDRLDGFYQFDFDVYLGTGYYAWSGVAPTLGDWYHLVGTWGSEGMNIYVNGIWRGSNPMNQPLSTDSNLDIVGGSSWPGLFVDSVIDEVAFFDYALNPEEVYQVYLLGLYGNTPSDWLMIEPRSGTIPANAHQDVTLTFDGIHPQPGVYTATINLLSNDPLLPLVDIPVTMTVELPDNAGLLNGNITSLGYCDGDPAPLAGAEVLIESSTGITWTTITDADGDYAWWLLADGNPYTLTVSASEHLTGQAGEVIITAQQTATVNLELRWLVPCPSVQPESLAATMPPEASQTLTMTLSNTGADTLTFEFWESERGYLPTLAGDLVELHIPAAPAEAPAGSAIAAGPYSPRAEQSYPVQRRILLDNAPDVLLLHSDDGDGDWIKSQLLAYGDLSSVATYDARTSTPHLTDLLPYDVILTWPNYEYDDPVAIGDVLADYVDAGGKVINMIFALGNSGWQMEGRFMNEAYTAMNSGPLEYSDACLGTYDPTHPIFAGVTSVCEFYRLQDTYLTPASRAIARWDDGEVYVAAKNNGTVVSIVGYVGYYYRWSGQMDLVVHNSIFWLVGRQDVDWLSTEPVSGTVPADGGIEIIEVTFNSTGKQPGDYTANLVLRSNDLMNPTLSIPLTMTVQPTTSIGWVEGIVTDLRTGQPLEATIVAEGQPYVVISDPETGYYKLWLEEGSYTLLTSAPDYVTQAVTVEITAQQGIPQDFALLLDAPWLQYTPESLNVSQVAGNELTETLILTNAGTADLSFYFAGDTSIEGNVLLLNLNETPGSDIFSDASGYNNDGYCSGGSCPLSGVAGKYNLAVSFDGVDDYVIVDDSPSLSPPQITISVWVKLNAIPNDWSPITFKEGPENRAWWFGFHPGRADRIHWSNGGLSTWELNADIPSALYTWRHIVVTYGPDGRRLYVDGDLIASDDASGNIPDTSGAMFIGGGGWQPLSGILDEIYIFDRALTTEEVQFLFQVGALPFDTTWLSVDPESGVLETDSSMPIQVNFDATDLTPDFYTTTLYLFSNDPLIPVAELPVTMTVTPIVTPTVVTINGPEQGVAGRSYAFTANVEPISVSQPITYLWQASGQEPITHTGGLSDTVTYIWDNPGIQVITVTASNDFGSVMGTHTITISDVPIISLVAYNDSPTLLGNPTTLSATISAGTNVTFAWDFGDESSGSGAVVSHTYVAVGVYTATVTASNAAGQVNATTRVTISPVYPLYFPLIFKASAQVQGALQP